MKLSWEYIYRPDDPDHQPHVFKPRWKPIYAFSLNEVVNWCLDQFGDRGLRWVCEAGHFWFRDQEDAFAFKMRWG